MSIRSQSQTAAAAAESSAEAAGDRVALSVIVPVRNDSENLELCLEALDASENADFEVIVVDDASTDTSPEVARRHGVRLIRQDTRTGPAAARNRGARAASHSFLFFLDADVRVRPETLRKVTERLQGSPSEEVFFGSYDAEPGAPGLVSQYRNLLHHYVHQSGNAEASTFWSGCGAIKKSVFLELGGFDTGYSSASVEDIELGSRLRRAGHRIALVKSVQVKHMKRWTFWRMLRTDIQNRGIPWTRLILREGKIPNDLNLRRSQRVSVLLAGALPATLAAGAWFREPVLLWLGAALGCLLGIVLLNQRFLRFLSSVKNPLFVLAALPLHVIYYLSSGVAFAAGLFLHLVRRPHRPGPEPT